jgi:hypothetical protein
MPLRASRRNFVSSKKATHLCCFAVALFFCLPLYSQLQATDVPASVILRRAVDGELKAQADDHSHWMYRAIISEGGKEEVKLVVETKDGELDRLQSVNGQPITEEQEKREDQRIQNLLNAPDRQKKRQHAQAEDAQQTERMFRLLPEVLNVRYGERKGDVVELLFEPNPNYHGWSREGMVFHEMEGRICVNTRQNRLAEIQGQLMRTVKFGGGLFGYLDKGGEFNVRQAEVGPGHWEVTLLHVNMHGRILFLKTISEQQHEIRTDYRQVPNDLSLDEAAQQLQKQSMIEAAKINAKLKPARGGVQGAKNTTPAIPGRHQ